MLLKRPMKTTHLETVILYLTLSFDFLWRKSTEGIDWLKLMWYFASYCNLSLKSNWLQVQVHFFEISDYWSIELAIIVTDSSAVFGPRLVTDYLQKYWAKNVTSNGVTFYLSRFLWVEKILFRGGFYNFF